MRNIILIYIPLLFSICTAFTAVRADEPVFRLADIEGFWRKTPKPAVDDLYLGQSYGSLGYTQTNCYQPVQTVYGQQVIVNPSQTVEKYWYWQTLPSGVLYRNYLAGMNESRMASVWNYEEHKDGLWSVTLGARIPVLRYGPRNTYYPEGFQVDVEGATRMRIDLDNNLGVDTTDFKFGVPLSFGNEMLQVKTGYVHISSSLSDRIVIINGQPVPERDVDYARDSWMLGISCQLPRNIRLYAEADYAFRGKHMKPWHFQFGAEYSSLDSTNVWGHPFVAANVHLMQEHDFDGSLCIQAGWQWRGQNSQIFRVGVQYLGGVSEQYKYISDKREHKIGLGLWYDF